MTQTIALQRRALLARRTRRKCILAGAVCARRRSWRLPASAGSTPALPDWARDRGANAPPAPPPMLVRQIRAVDAGAGDQQPASRSPPVPIRRPGLSSLGKADAATRARALECLTSAIYYEAGQESTRRPARGRAGRAEPRPPPGLPVQRLRRRLRRLDAPDRLPVHLHLRRLAGPRGRARRLESRPRRSPRRRSSGYVYAPVGNATHYHANYVVPYWALDARPRTPSIGAHIFYRWAGGWGRPAAFAQGYSRPRAERRRASCRCDRRRAARCRDARPGRRSRSRRSTKSQVPRRSSSTRRCAATSALRVLLQPEAREGGRRRRSTPIMSSTSRHPTICAGR